MKLKKMVSTNYHPLICVILIFPLAMLVLLLPATTNASDSEPPSQFPASVWTESCDFFGPPNITANPPTERNYRVWMKSFYLISDARPFSFDLTYNTDKLLPPGGRAVTQLTPANTGKTITKNEDLCGFITGGCPVHVGDFTLSFNITVDCFTEIQFSMFTKTGELLHCVYFEAS